MRHPVGDPHAQHAAIFRTGVGRGQLERGAVELIENVGENRAWVQRVAAGGHRGAGTQQSSASQSRARGKRIVHGVSQPLYAFRTSVGML